MAWSILDCTLRDGGYYTNWDFDSDLVDAYLNALDKFPVDYLEIGYCTPTQSGYHGKFFYLSPLTLARAAEQLSQEKKLAIMLDAKRCKAEDVPDLLKNYLGKVQLVRMAVSPNNLEKGIDLAKAVKACGFDVAVNLMYLSKLTRNFEVLSLFEPLGKVVDYLYLVDSYGSCFPHQVEAAITFAKKHLPQKIGFHGHDNISLAFANSLAALTAGVDIVDSTVLGMGRGAGNLRTELILAYLGQSPGKAVDLSPMADLLELFQKLKDKYQWGSDLPYVVSGLADLPQKEVMEWIGKKRYSTSLIVQALQGKQQTLCDSRSYPKLGNGLNELGLKTAKTCVVVGGGSTAQQHAQAIIKFVKNQNSLLIHSSLKNSLAYAEEGVTQILCLPGREAEKLKRFPSYHLKKQFAAYILASAPRMTNTITEDLEITTFEVDPITPGDENSTPDLLDRDSPLGLALSVACSLNAEKIFLTGFDGYSGGTEVQQELAQEVQSILDSFAATHPHTQLLSLTPTQYTISQSSVYALIASGTL